MNASVPARQSSWSRRLLIALTLIIVGALAATWALARFDGAARLLGVDPAPPPAAALPNPQPARAARPQLAAGAQPEPASETTSASLANLEARLSRVENATRRAEGSAGRADALVVAFAARRALDRGAPLGYLEPLLVDRFGPQHPRAVATIVTASRAPVRLDQLVSEYQELAPKLRTGGPEESWWDGFRREMGSLIEIRRASRPSPSADARYRRALSRLSAGDVDAALAETMRMPGAGQARGWVDRARQYVNSHRALDEIEASALMAGSGGAR